MEENNNSELSIKKDYKEKNEVKENKKKTNIFLIAVITAVLFFMIYVFVSQFLAFKNNEVNSKITLQDQKPN